MKFTDLFIQRPVLALVVSMLIIVAGLQAVSSLNVRQYPQSENATVSVTTVYVGASAELVRGFITTPLERVIAEADGIEHIESLSSQGLSTINVRLKLNYDPIKALSQITSKIDQVRNDLPPEAEVPIIDVMSADSQFASAYLSFSSDILQQNEITEYLIRIVEPRLTAIPGVQSAEVIGGRTFAMRVWLKPERMAAFNVTPIQVREALAANNFLAAPGSTKGALIELKLTTDTNLQSVDEFKRLIIRQETNGVVRLEDIGEVVLGAEDYNTEVRFSGDTAVFIGIFVQPNANTLDVIQSVRTVIEDIKTKLPTGLEAAVGYDATEYITAAIDDVVMTLTETLIIVIIVIYLFLGSLRSALIPIVVIPLSLIGAVFLMQIFGFTINLLTLLAVVLSVGLVVDDAIVVVENVERHMSEGKSPFNAALLGARELVNPIIAMTITLTAVYLPIGLQGGLTGSLFKEFAFTLAGAVAISGVVALTLSPMMASKLMKKGQEEHGFAARTNRFFNKVKQHYSRLLQTSLDARWAVYLFWLVISLLTIPMFMLSTKELAPTEDQGVIFGIVEAPANATLEYTALYADAANKTFLSYPETEFSFQITNPTSGFGGIVLKPWDERDKTVFEVQNEMQGPLSTLTGISLFPVTPPALPGGGQFPVEFVITSSAEIEEIVSFAQQLQQKAATSGMFAFPPTLDVKIDQPEAQLSINRNRVGDLGLTLEQVGADIGSMVGGGFVNRFSLDGRSYKVIPQIERSERLTVEQLQDMYVTGPDGELIQLGALIDINYRTVPRTINRFQQLNSVKLSGVNTRSLDQALSFLEQAAAEILPEGYSVDYTGESRQLRAEGNSFLLSFVLAVTLIFLVLSAQFNSFRDPLVILAGSVPLAMFGALIFTFLKMPAPNFPFWTNGWTTTLNIYSQIGLVTLVGLIAKNGILIVEFANQLQAQGRDKMTAIHEAAITRLRPVLMTTVATIAGHFPLVLVTGAGAAARNSIGLVLVGGMFVGTLFTLFVIPSIYMLIARNHSADQTRTETLALDQPQTL